MKNQIKKYTEGNEGLIAKIAIVGLAYVGIVHPLLKKIGLFESKEESERKKIAKDNATSPGSPFNPSYYKGKSGGLLLYKAQAQKLAELLYDADGYFNDDEDQVYGVFRQLKAKTQVSFLSEVFFQMYQKDMYAYLNAFLDADEMDIVNSIVSKLQPQ